MLTISKALTTGHVRSYFAEEYSAATAQYYTDGAQVTGWWHGRLAAEFGLVGRVQEIHFARLAEGQHPHDTRQLVQHRPVHTYVTRRGEIITTREHRAGWDATFSAPKSVSLVALVGGDARVRLAHRESVTIALRALEASVQARLGGDRTPETTERFAAAAFEHDSARPVDGYAAPQLHTHAVIFNVTRTEAHRFRALQPRELFKSQAFATAVYRAELGHRLRALGYAIDPGRHGQPEIRGLTPDYLEAASPRRRQIVDLLEAHGRSGAGAAEIVAHQSRDRKAPQGRAEVQAQHQAMAATFGHQAAQAVEAARPRARALGPDPAAAAGALAYAKEWSMERTAVVDERHLLTDALRRGLGRVTLRDAQREFERRREAGEFLARERLRGAAARCWTTPEMEALERATIDRIHQHRHRDVGAPLVPHSVRQALDPSLTAMTPDQRQAIHTVLGSHAQAVALDGIAGSGKTTALTAIRLAAERAGYVVHGAAPTSRAAALLTDVGIPSQTLQRVVLRQDARDPRPHLMVLDESSLASTVLMKALLDRTRPQDRLLLAGDMRQHQSVDAGKSYEQLQEHGLPTAHLTTIVRQRDPQLRHVVRELAAGHVQTALAELSAMGKVHVIPDRQARLAAVATMVVADPSRTLVVCPDNRSRQELNGAIHRARQEAGAVQADHETPVLVPKPDMTGIDRAYADRYDVGDTVRYTKGSRTLGLDPGSDAVVTARECDTNAITVRRADGQVVTYDPRRLRGVTVYEAETRAFAVGDRVQFTARSAPLGVANRDLGTIAALADGQVRITLDAGRDVTFAVGTHPHLDFGYAVTSHAAQSQTVDRVIVHVDTDRAAESVVNQRLAYVAPSRGRDDMQILTDNGAALWHALSRDVSHRAAIERAATPQQAHVPGPQQGLTRP